MMCAFLIAYPHLSGTVLDLPKVIAEKDELWARRLAVEERCLYMAADMFKEVHNDADVYSLKMILHDWNDSECRKILYMMCWGSGQERTEEEYASLLEASGWRFVAYHYPLHASIGVVEAVPVKAS
jgi:hypothetical protein